MSELTVDDFKNVLLDLYLVQREKAQLQLKLAELAKERLASKGADEED